MFRIVSLFLLLGFSALIFSCQSSTNSNNSVNTSANVNTQSVPIGNSSSSSLPRSMDTPVGVPANVVNSVPKGATPTPGIPDPRMVNKKVKPGATPTPGIPDLETIKRQMQGLEKPNVNLAAPGDMMMMKKKKPVNKPE